MQLGHLETDLSSVYSEDASATNVHDMTSDSSVLFLRACSLPIGLARPIRLCASEDASLFLKCQPQWKGVLLCRQGCLP